ncbi:MAG TPA: hypothetical protein VK326_05785 [Solirubrobacterales bacterium]|nr:hypothetical protein [Solirubrobacterales bacterium]
MTATAFYCVTGRDFFCGAVALFNSLRLAGHSEPFVVLDCGMTPGQRAVLGRHATIVEAPSEEPPSTLKLVAPGLQPAEVMVLLDADVIVTGSLAGPIRAAAAGRVVAFENDVDRHFASWSELLDLPEVRRDRYLSSSAILAGGEPGRRLLEAMGERLPRVDRAGTWVADGDPGDALFFLDQDVFNAVARSLLAPREVEALPARLAPIPPFAGIRLLDAGALRCAYRDGVEPFLLHHASHKPWLVRMRTNVYSRLLTRLLLAPDVTLRLDSDELPLRLRSGAAARLDRALTDIVLIAPGLARRIRGRPAPVAAWPRSRSA